MVQYLKSLAKVMMDAFDVGRRPTLDFDYADTDGHLVLPRRCLVNNRYEVEDSLGSGSFGQVWKVRDISSVNASSDLRGAMKVSLRERKKENSTTNQVISSLNNNHTYAEDSTREVAILKDLNSLSIDNKGHIVKLLDSFEIAERVFIIMELLDLNIFEFLYSNYFEPFPSDQALHISYQILSAMDFLHYHTYLHTDIKPENIVLVCGDYTEVPNPCKTSIFNEEESPLPKRGNSTLKMLKRTDIRIVDFGCAIYLEARNNKRHGTLGTREYRAPESVLSLKCHLPADMWSVGCTLFDVWVGFTLMNEVKNDVQQLLRMETVFGPLPQRFLDNSPSKFLQAREICMNKGFRGWENPEDKPGDPSFYPLPTRLFNYFDQTNELQIQAFHLIRNLLQYEPVSRYTAGEALKDPLFNSLAPSFKH